MIVDWYWFAPRHVSATAASPTVGVTTIGADGALFDCDHFVVRYACAFATVAESRPPLTKMISPTRPVRPQPGE